LLGELWRELGESMRRIRLSNGLSLRQLEALSGWTRGTLSQVENAKAKPSRALVQWYDERLQTHGLLMSIYAEASAAHPHVGPIDAASDVEHGVPGDGMKVIESDIPAGLLAQPDSTQEAGWRIANVGSVPWRRRGLRRIGAYAGVRVISSARVTAVGDVDPGETTTVRCSIRLPDTPGTVIAYWRMVDEHDRYCFSMDAVLSVLLTIA
jgi:transcriptional regulator with XRE-family HTH domain